MRKILLVIILLVFSLSVFAQVSIKPLNIKQRTLDNGLQVISVQDKSNPIVTVQVWYRVGGKNDPEGKSGFAHMFEHMLFKSTKNMPNEKMDRLTEDVGGFNNAFTAEDVTAYYEVIPSNYLETLLWAESDRMVNLTVDEKNFASERDVVKEEYRQRIEANPYGMLFNYIDSLSFTVHPYKRGVIGDLDQLNAATRDDAFAFYKEYYRPDNASLIVVGDFDEEKFNQWVDKYFGRIKKPEGEIERVKVTEPERTEEVRFVKYRPNVPLPALGITYLIPPTENEDLPALEVATAILSDGESSRLYQELVYKQQLAQTAFLNLDNREEKGLIAFFGIAAGGKTVEALEKSFYGVIANVQQNGVTAKELEKAKNKLITNILQERESVDGKATAIGQAIIYQNDATAVNNDVQKLQSVTAEDVKNVMNKYIKDNNRVVIYYKNEAKDGGKE